MKMKLLAALTALTLTTQAMDSPVRRTTVQEQRDLDRAIAMSLQGQYNQRNVLSEEDEMALVMARSLKEHDDSKQEAGPPIQEDDLDVLHLLINYGGTVQDIRKHLESGGSVNAQFGVTPLMEAARQGRGAVCALLIVKGANVKAQDLEGNTALDRAIKANNIKICRLLIGKGADLNPPPQGTTLLQRALLSNCDDKLYRYLVACAAKQ